MSKQFRADLLLLMITVIWGASFTLMKNTLHHIPSVTYLALRFIIATLLLLFIFHKKLRLFNKYALLYGAVIGLMLFGGMMLQVSGLYFTSASNSAFITGFNVVMVPVVSAFFLRKKPDIFSIAGVILAFGGLFFLSGGLNFHFNKGDFLTFLCAVCFTFQIIFIDKFTAKQDAALLSVLQIGFAAFLYFCVFLATDFSGVMKKPDIILNPTVVITLIITGILGTALAFAVQTIVQKDTSPTHTALILTAEPVFGAVFALLIPNTSGGTEVLKLNMVTGCVLILAGMIICEIKGKKAL